MIREAKVVQLPDGPEILSPGTVLRVSRAYDLQSAYDPNKNLHSNIKVLEPTNAVAMIIGFSYIFTHTVMKRDVIDFDCTHAFFHNQPGSKVEVILAVKLPFKPVGYSWNQFMRIPLDPIYAAYELEQED
jgi:hypothetical protein